MSLISIYKITNKINKHFYIGSSKNTKKRWNEHRNDLKNNKHHSKYLQRAWNKYGGRNFDFMIVEECSINNLVNREQFYIDTLKPNYNVGLFVTSPMRGKIISDETRKKISLANKGKKISDETRKKISLANSGENNSNTKLKKYMVLEIRKKYKPFKYSQNKLAKEYCVSTDCISDIVNYISWKHI